MGTIGAMPTRCYLLTPTALAQKSLRRYRGITEGEPRCEASGIGFHNASVRLGTTKRLRHGDDGRPLTGWQLKDLPHSDPRWPTHCPCGYAFTGDDHWQHMANLLWRCSDRLDDPADYVTLGEARPGAMWYADWQPADWKGPDGRSLVVRCPNGLDWSIDAPSTRSGGRWTRTGEPPAVSVTPSIAIGMPGAPNYGHYWLGVNGSGPGVFSDHLG